MDENAAPGGEQVRQHRAVEHALRDFHLAGVDLEKEAKDRFKAIMQELAETQAEFEHNVQDASDAWSLLITDDENLRGLPQSLVARAAEDARKEDKDGWLFSLDFPTYDAVMRQADSRDLRAAFYRGWVTRGSDEGADPKWDNSGNIERILELRHEAANLVGFDNYAEYSLATKMADIALNEGLERRRAREESSKEQDSPPPSGDSAFVVSEEQIELDVVESQIQRLLRALFGLGTFVAVLAFWSSAFPLVEMIDSVGIPWLGGLTLLQLATTALIGVGTVATVRNLPGLLLQGAAGALGCYAANPNLDEHACQGHRAV